MARRTWFTLSLGFLSCLSLAGCDSSSGEEDRDGSFQAQVTGAFSQQLDGPAIFGSSPVGYEEDGTRYPLFAIQLQADGEDPFVLISIERIGSDAMPVVGTYESVRSRAEIENVMEDFVVTLTRSDDNPFIFDPFPAASGTVEITRSEQDRVEGRVQFTGDGGSGRQIQFTGTFQAVRGH